MIAICDLNVSFQRKKVLSEISMEIKRGQITGLYGESGIGKSTISRVLTGLVKPDSGRIMYKTQELWIKGKYDRTTGRTIQMVYQQPEASLDPSYRIGNTLDEVLRVKRIPKEKRREKILEVISSLGLKEEILGHFPYQISGGEAQRVSLARCLLAEPEVLILDEATSMLDSETQAFLLNWLRRNYLNEDRGILFISHDWELTEFYCNEIYILGMNGVEKYEKK